MVAYITKEKSRINIGMDFLKKYKNVQENINIKVSSEEECLL